MHEHCEIIMPPTEDIESAIESIMKPFSEHEEDEDGEMSKYAFWDSYVIGGRWAGTKLKQKSDQDKIKKFYDWLNKEKVTVSGLICGKEELSPPEQQEKVDKKWNEMFPSEEFIPCPLFKHSNNQYDSSDLLPDDICKLADIGDTECYRVIVAGPSYNHETEEHDGPPKAVFMIEKQAWNGVNFTDISWDGTVKSALKKHEKKLEGYRDSYRKKVTPKDDWLVVTVDYHS